MTFNDPIRVKLEQIQERARKTVEKRVPNDNESIVEKARLNNALAQHGLSQKGFEALSDRVKEACDRLAERELNAEEGATGHSDDAWDQYQKQLIDQFGETIVRAAMARHNLGSPTA